MWARATMALQSDHDHTFIGHIDIFHIASVLLKIGTNLLQGILNLLFHNCFFLVGHKDSLFESHYKRLSRKTHHQKDITGIICKQETVLQMFILLDSLDAKSLLTLTSTTLTTSCQRAFQFADFFDGVLGKLHESLAFGGRGIAPERHGLSFVAALGDGLYQWNLAE